MAGVLSSNTAPLMKLPTGKDVQRLPHTETVQRQAEGHHHYEEHEVHDRLVDG